MQLLSSKNYEKVMVHVREFDQPVILTPSKGLKLMDYLTGNPVTKHVKLTDVSGEEMVVSIADIKLVVPIAEIDRRKGNEKYV